MSGLHSVYKSEFWMNNPKYFLSIVMLIFYIYFYSKVFKAYGSPAYSLKHCLVWLLFFYKIIKTNPCFKRNCEECITHGCSNKI